MTWELDEAGARLPMDELITDHGQPEMEPLPGITRRRWLWLSALTAATIFSRPLNLRAQSMTNTDSGKTDTTKNQTTIELGWDDFLKQCVPVAQELHRDSSKHGQDAYLLW